MSSEVTRSKIEVMEQTQHEIAADRADLFVTVEGLSLFTGQEALKKAREVAQLAADLQAFGLPSDVLFLQGVTADIQTGMLSKTSRAKYRLRIHCADLSMLADIIGIIAAQKNTALHKMEWGYPDDTDQKETWMLACIARANNKIAKIAAALGVRITGVAAFSESIQDSETPLRYSDRGGTMHRERVSSEDLGMEVSHTKTITVSVSVEYLISGYDAKQ